MFDPYHITKPLRIRLRSKQLGQLWLFGTTFHCVLVWLALPPLNTPTPQHGN